MANSNKGEELRLLYQDIIDNIRYSKQQQWNTVYLTLVAIGAILALVLGLYSKPFLYECLLLWLSIICYIIAGLGIYFIVNYQIDIAKYRYQKEEIIKTFSLKAQAIAQGPKLKEYFKWEFFGKDVVFVFLFCLLIFVAWYLGFSLIAKIS